MDYVAEAKRHVDTILALMKMDYVTVYLTAEVYAGHYDAFVDIFANGLSEPERNGITDYIRDQIKQLPYDFQRISANLLFFNTVECNNE